MSMSVKREADDTIFNNFGMSRPGIEPVTSRSPERTLYRLSYRGCFIEKFYNKNDNKNNLKCQ